LQQLQIVVVSSGGVVVLMNMMTTIILHWGNGPPSLLLPKSTHPSLSLLKLGLVFEMVVTVGMATIIVYFVVVQ
jgi:hypothetical protein